MCLLTVHTTRLHVGVKGDDMTMTSPAPMGTAGRRPTVRIEADHWYSLADVANHYALARTTAREMIAAGMIPATKVGRGWRVYGADILAEDARRRAESTRAPLAAVRPGAPGVGTPEGADIATAV